MLKIAICDDDSSIHNELKEHLTSLSIKYNEDIDIRHYYNTDELLKAPFDFRILFLDMMLGNHSDGIQVGKRLRSMNHHALFIIISSRKDKYAESFQATTLQYLIKPLTLQKLDRVIQEALSHILYDNDYLRISYRQVKYYIHIKDIILIESFMRQRHIITDHAKYTTNENWDTLLIKLEKYSCFIRLGKSYYINMSRVRSVSQNAVTMDNGQVINLTKNAQNKFHIRFNEFLNE